MKSTDRSPGGQVLPAFENLRIHQLVAEVSAERIEGDLRGLVDFGTRHSFSASRSRRRGIGAARRWLAQRLEQIAAESGGRLEVHAQSEPLPAGPEVMAPRNTELVNLLGVQRGRLAPHHYLLMLAHYDSRGSDGSDYSGDAPGANDNASGVAALLETARLLSRYPSDLTVVYAAVAGEEQGLLGSRALAERARQEGWRVEGVLNNDIIGNSRGAAGTADSTSVRVFAPGIHPGASEAELRRYLATGGEMDGPSRQLARRIARAAATYLPGFEARVIYRIDRMNRGGDHKPFFERGFPAVRIVETHEDDRRQHQGRNPAGGGESGDLPEAVDFGYLARVTALNVATLASLAWAPPAPARVEIQGSSRPTTALHWDPAEVGDLLGYRVYWRHPTETSWTHSRWVGDVREARLPLVADNYFFGVAAVDREGNESLVVFPAA